MSDVMSAEDKELARLKGKSIQKYVLGGAITLGAGASNFYSLWPLVMMAGPSGAFVVSAVMVVSIIGITLFVSTPAALGAGKDHEKRRLLRRDRSLEDDYRINQNFARGAMKLAFATTAAIVTGSAVAKVFLGMAALSPLGLAAVAAAGLAVTVGMSVSAYGNFKRARHFQAHANR